MSKETSENKELFAIDAMDSEIGELATAITDALGADKHVDIPGVALIFTDGNGRVIFQKHDVIDRNVRDVRLERHARASAGPEADEGASLPTYFSVRDNGILMHQFVEHGRRYIVFRLTEVIAYRIDALESRVRKLEEGLEHQNELLKKVLTECKKSDGEKS